VDIKAPENESIYGQYRYEIPVIRINESTVLRNRQITADVLRELLRDE
jgi:uncharacterized linocin/CFP29 family protein